MLSLVSCRMLSLALSWHGNTRLCERDRMREDVRLCERDRMREDVSVEFWVSAQAGCRVKVKRHSGREKDTGGLVVPMMVGSPEEGEKRVGTVGEKQKE